MAEQFDVIRLREEYARRKEQLAGNDKYSPFNRVALFLQQQREREVLRAIGRLGVQSNQNPKVVDVGCGHGGVLLDFLSYGIRPKLLYGNDLLFDRVNQTHNMLPHLPVICADGQHLPYPDHYFDLTLINVVASSILDDTVKYRLAQELIRITRKSGGAILWYDFIFNPVNHQTKGIGAKELRRLFPQCKLEFRRITLAPPLARILLPLSWTLAAILEKTRIFNSHYLVVIKPN
ncbi:MAG: class I SAM-dependent methyltransferase [Anaerolineae bacterium]|nr:class I SAM-dependent methyltransferase [Anaerolineae bacterium]